MPDTQGIPQDLIDRAAELVRAEREAKARARRILEERDAAVVAALAATPSEVSDNEVARRVGLEPSTFRSITVELRRQRRARQP